jgi:hypothetical protein
MFNGMATSGAVLSFILTPLSFIWRIPIGAEKDRAKYHGLLVGTPAPETVVPDAKVRRGPWKETIVHFPYEPPYKKTF